MNVHKPRYTPASTSTQNNIWMKVSSRVSEELYIVLCRMQYSVEWNELHCSPRMVSGLTCSCTLVLVSVIIVVPLY